MISERLDRMGTPDGVTQGQWERLLWSAEVFMAAWIGTATAMGWQNRDIFGAQPHSYPLSVSGGLLVELARVGGDVIDLTGDYAVVKSPRSESVRWVLRLEIPDELIPLWKLPASKQPLAIRRKK